jgi:hypothetical protein
MIKCNSRRLLVGCISDARYRDSVHGFSKAGSVQQNSTSSLRWELYCLYKKIVSQHVKQRSSLVQLFSLHNQLQPPIALYQLRFPR